MITISDFLMFSPFDNKVNSDFLRQVFPSYSLQNKIIDKEKAFWDKFYFDNTPYFQNTTKMLVDGINNSNNHYILFKGPSGSGKTTFLNQFVRDKNNNFRDAPVPPFFDIVNLIKYPFIATTEPKLLISVLYDKILAISDKELIRRIYDTIFCNGRNSLEEIDNIKKHINSYPKFLEAIGNCFDNYSLGTVRDYLESVTNVNEVITLYFVFCIFKYSLFEKVPIVFIFDNLDELESKYLVRNLTKDLRDAFSNAQGFFDKFKGTDTIAGDYDFISNCTIIESVREGFVADVNSCQLEERLGGQSIPIGFDGGYRQSIYEIFDKRIQLFQNFQNIDKHESKKIIRVNRELVENEKKYIEELCQLFNHDYRVTLTFLGNAFGEDISAWSNFSMQDSDCRLGIRGLLLFHMLKSLFIKNETFSKYVHAELREDTCNRNRMYMSLLTNMYVDESKRKPITETVFVSLGEFTKRVKNWYENIAVDSIYSTLFVSDNKNFSIPASLEGIPIDDFYREKLYDVTLNGVCKYIANLFRENRDLLNDINIVVNPVCLEYTQHVFINFEYFNLISIADLADYEAMYGAKSLFQYDNYEDIAACLKRVFKVTNLVVRRADNQICSRCRVDCSDIDLDIKESFCTAQVDFLDKNNFLIKPNTLYKTRVISQHINYLDSFRKMLWLKYRDNQEENERHQKLLLDSINKYISLFKNGKAINISAKESMMKIERDYDEALKRGCLEWYPVSIGRG